MGCHSKWISGIFCHNSLSCFGDLLTQFRRIKDLNVSSFAQHPADHFMLDGGAQRDNQRTIFLTLNLEFLHLLMLVQIKCDFRIAAELNPVDFRIIKKAVPPRILHQFAIGVKGIDSKRDRFHPLNCITFDIFSAVFIAFRIPDSPVKGNDMRLEFALLCSSVRFPVGDGKDLMLPPAFKNIFEDCRIHRCLDGCRAQQRFEHGFIEKVRTVPGQRLFHGGIDIANKKGTNIYAADGGVVTHAGWMSSYGYLIIIDHQNGYTTYYGHNSKLLVSEGDKVYKGEHIAEMGATGRVTGTHCHFEVRYNDERQNPLDYLP